MWWRLTPELTSTDDSKETLVRGWGTTPHVGGTTAEEVRWQLGREPGLVSGAAEQPGELKSLLTNPPTLWFPGAGNYKIYRGARGWVGGGMTGSYNLIPEGNRPSAPHLHPALGSSPLGQLS